MSFLAGNVGRAKKLIRKVDQDGHSFVWDESRPGELSTGGDSMIETTRKTKYLNKGVFDGLDTPVWRKNWDDTAGEMIERRPYEDWMLGTESIPAVANAKPGETLSLRTTVCFGKSPHRSSRPCGRKRNLRRGMQATAAACLLEGLVMCNTVHSQTLSGAWATRMYGGSACDIWEVFTVRAPHITPTAAPRGWRCLQPLDAADFGTRTFQDHVNTTLDAHGPTFLVMHAPGKIRHSAANLVKTDSHTKPNYQQRERRRDQKQCKPGLLPLLLRICQPTA